MDGQAILTVSGSVVALVQLMKWAGLPDGYGPLGVLVASIFGVSVWGYSRGQFEQALLFDYFAGTIAVMTSAAGVFGFTRAAGDALAKFKGTGNGAAMALLPFLLVTSLLAGCSSGVVPPITNPATQSEAGQTALLAAQLTDQATAGIQSIGEMGRLGILPANTIVTIADQGARLGNAVKQLTADLRTYAAVRSVQNYTTAKNSLASVKAILNAIFERVDPSVQDRVRGALAKAADLAFDIALTLRPPEAALLPAS